MALRLFLPLLLLLLVATLLISQAQALGSSLPDCCLKYSQKAIPMGMVTSYRLQGRESGCLLHAVVFTTRRNKQICASPMNDAVQKLMEHLDKKPKNNRGRKRAQNQGPKSKARKQRRQRV